MGFAGVPDFRRSNGSIRLPCDRIGQWQEKEVEEEAEDGGKDMGDVAISAGKSQKQNVTQALGGSLF